MELAAATGIETGRLRLFISYSRADLAFADELAGGLEIDGAFDIAMDRHSIIEGEDWKKRLGALIADSDTVVFLLSPASAKSEVCQWEVDEAVRLTKRIVPVLVTPLGAQSAPAALAALNYVRFDPLDDGKPRSFTAGIKGLIRALKSDLGWLREHTRLLARATEWAEAGRPANRLLTGDAVPEAKAWAARRPKDAPALNALHLDFIAESEREETTRQGEAAQALAERERLVAQAEQAAREREKALDEQRAALRASARMQRVASGLMIVVIVGLLGWMNQSRIAEEWFKVRHVYPYVLSASQERALKPLGPPFKECTDCPEMIVVPSGEFMMGSPEGEGEPNEHPQHSVKIGKSFAIGRFATTFDEWDRCFALGGCKNPAAFPLAAGLMGGERGRRPVRNVSQKDARQYVEWLSKITGQRYRLLTEAEWEYAARAGTTTKYFFGNDEAFLSEYTFYSKLIGMINWELVDSKKPNPWGLYNMHADVCQWVNDQYTDSYATAKEDGSQPNLVSYGIGMIRGNSTKEYGPRYFRSAYRTAEDTDFFNDRTGFRVARTLLPPGK